MWCPPNGPTNKGRTRHPFLIRRLGHRRAKTYSIHDAAERAPGRGLPAKTLSQDVRDFPKKPMPMSEFTNQHGPAMHPADPYRVSCRIVVSPIRRCRRCCWRIKLRKAHRRHLMHKKAASARTQAILDVITTYKEFRLGKTYTVNYYSRDKRPLKGASINADRHRLKARCGLSWPVPPMHWEQWAAHISVGHGTAGNSIGIHPHRRENGPHISGRNRLEVFRQSVSLWRNIIVHDPQPIKPLGISSAHAFIKAACAARVARHRYQRQLRKLCLEHRTRAVIRSVVDHEDLIHLPRLLLHTIETLAECIFPVVCYHHSGNAVLGRRTHTHLRK
jgi:hypothetical protein